MVIGKVALHRIARLGILGVVLAGIGGPAWSQTGGSVPDALSGRDLYHGNYCGFGNRGDGLEPVDALDEACRQHDACWGAAGYKSCACDRSLKSTALALADDDGVAPEVRRRAGSIAQAADAMGCTRP